MRSKRFYFCCTMLLVVILSSCKAKRAVVDGAVDASLSTKKIIQNHYAKSLDFDTMNGKVKIDYVAGDTQQGVTVSLRMKKDEAIWVSAPLGLFKAYITPERVSFYNKLENEYFDGDFQFLTEFLGYEMDFNKVQNLLIGNTVLDLRDEKYVSYLKDDRYILKPKKDNDLFKILFSLEPNNFRVRDQQVSQPLQERYLNLEYGYQNIATKVAPSEVKIAAVNEDGVRNIALDFRNIEFDKKLNFPYKIPKGFKSVVAK